MSAMTATQLADLVQRLNSQKRTELKTYLFGFAKNAIAKNLLDRFFSDPNAVINKTQFIAWLESMMLTRKVLHGALPSVVQKFRFTNKIVATIEHKNLENHFPRAAMPPQPKRGGPSRALTPFRGSVSHSALKRSSGGGGAAKKVVPKKATKARASAKVAIKKRSSTKGRQTKDPSTVSCQVKAQVNKTLTLNLPSPVKVTVARKLTASIENGMTGGKVGLNVLKKKPLTLKIRPLRHCLAVGEDEQTIKVPEEGVVKELEFTILPKHMGVIAFHLEILQGRVLLGSVKLEPTCERKKTVSGKLLEQEVETSLAKPYPKNICKLNIREVQMGKQTHYEFEFDAPPIRIFQSYRSENLKGNRDYYIKRLYRQIEDLSLHTVSPDEFLRRLKEWGAHLYDELIPIALGKVLYGNRKSISNVLVISNEPFIPWELLLIKKPGEPGYRKGDTFFGEMGLVRWQFGTAMTQDLFIRKGQAHYVIPNYRRAEAVLEETRLEEQFLEKELQARKVNPDPGSVLALLRSKNGFDLLHLACHGEAVSKSISESQLLLKEVEINGKLKATYLPQLSVAQSTPAPKGLRPIVVINACQTGRQGFQLTRMGGFASAFLGYGAGLFVGALWSVGDRAAREFAEAFYKHLKKGLPLSQASIKARAETKAKNPIDATWLAYVIYGDPFARLQVT